MKWLLEGPWELRKWTGEEGVLGKGNIGRKGVGRVFPRNATNQMWLGHIGVGAGGWSCKSRGCEKPLGCVEQAGGAMRTPSQQTPQAVQCQVDWSTQSWSLADLFSPSSAFCLSVHPPIHPLTILHLLETYGSLTLCCGGPQVTRYGPRPLEAHWRVGKTDSE